MRSLTRQYDYTTLCYGPWQGGRRLFQRLFAGLFKLLTRVEIEGLENLPSQGPYLLAVNHLDLFDAPLIFMAVSRRTVIFAADKWARIPVANFLLTYIGSAIYVNRGAPDRSALNAALAVLNAGGGLGVAPEGTRSENGTLGQGHPGIAYLATRGQAPIIPIVAYGQEKSGAYWRRLRRVPVYIRMGDPILLTDGKARTPQLKIYTDQIMLALAELLPLEYRGVYSRTREP